MKHEDKAIELVNEFRRINENGFRVIKLDHAKTCAMICVRELLKNDYSNRSFIYEYDNKIIHCTYSEYWTNVLIQISKL